MHSAKKKNSKGIFITLEGTEGSGKSTLIRSLSEALVRMKLNVTQTREPGGSPLAEQIRKLVLEQSMDPRTELLLYEAARSEHLAQTIRPALAKGHIVLCDRFTDSTLAYQAHARGLSWKEVHLFNQLTTGGLTPHLTLFLDLPPHLGLMRAQDANRFEAEGVPFQEKVRSGYLKARRQNPKRWLTLKVNHQSPEQLTEKVISDLKRRFKTYFLHRGDHG